MPACGCWAARRGPGGLDLRATLVRLHEALGVCSVLVEGGAGLLGALFEAGCVDTALAYVAPLLLGDEMARAVAVGRVAPALASGVRLVLGRVRRVGDDVELTYCREGVCEEPSPLPADEPVSACEPAPPEGDQQAS
ncbi:MAG: hypothetical protein KatS3mg103_0294 [Phycisphaerales bacterium]|nr:MAG: hypothetical protein KatS3mg103_0294 [Phycisphaerales bacterium]